MTETSRIRVNLSAVENNVRVVREIIGPDCVLCPIVKADAYGLGAPPIARHLAAAGADMLAVYTTAQAAELARAAVGTPILVLSPVREMQRIDESYRLLIQGNLHLTVHDPDHLDELVRLAEGFATMIPLHVEVDTGMSRGGCSPAQVPQIARRIAEHRWLRLAGLSTHFACAGTDGEFTAGQLAAFDAVVRKSGSAIPGDCLIHAANTLATLRHRRYHRRMVRVGQAWAGFGPESIADSGFRRHGARLRPIVTWKSRIVQVKTIERGATVGYGAQWTARRRSRIGLVPVGYGDGYPIGLASTDAQKKPACVGVEMSAGEHRFVRVVGQVNMDQITIDLTDLCSPNRRRAAAVETGTPVELIGTDPAALNHVPTLAASAGTPPHQILCGLSTRIKRIYHARESYEKGHRPPATGRRLRAARQKVS